MPPNSADAAIVATGLVKHYGDVKALDGLDLVVPRGGVYGLLGPNGAGKTTIVRILTTLLRADAGDATVAGFDVRTHPDDVRKSIGLTGQFAAVDEYLTGRENLDMVGRLYHLAPSYVSVKAEELLERFDLTDAADRISKTYSGGMRRRLDLAASLIAVPEVLFLDEPTTGLDPRSASRCGRSSRGWCSTARRCCSRPSTSRRRTSSLARSSSSTAAGSSRRAPPTS